MEKIWVYFGAGRRFLNPQHVLYMEVFSTNYTLCNDICRFVRFPPHGQEWCCVWGEKEISRNLCISCDPITTQSLWSEVIIPCLPVWEYRPSTEDLCLKWNRNLRSLQPLYVVIVSAHPLSEVTYYGFITIQHILKGVSWMVSLTMSPLPPIPSWFHQTFSPRGLGSVCAQIPVTWSSSVAVSQS